MELTAAIIALAKLALLLAGLLVPGAMLMRALRVPVTVATSFAGSAVALYATVLALQFTSITISLASLTGGLAAVTLVVIVLVARFGRSGTATEENFGISETEHESPLSPLRQGFAGQARAGLRGERSRERKLISRRRA